MLPHWLVLAAFVGGPILGLVEWTVFVLLLSRLTSIPEWLFTISAIAFAVIGVFQLAWFLDKMRTPRRDVQDR